MDFPFSIPFEHVMNMVSTRSWHRAITSMSVTEKRTLSSRSRNVRNTQTWLAYDTIRSVTWSSIQLSSAGCLVLQAFRGGLNVMNLRKSWSCAQPPLGKTRCSHDLGPRMKYERSLEMQLLLLQPTGHFAEVTSQRGSAAVYSVHFQSKNHLGNHSRTPNVPNPLPFPICCFQPLNVLTIYHLQLLQPMQTISSRMFYNWYLFYM